MSIHIPRGTPDPVIDGMMVALRAYEADHARARIDLYRHDPVSVRVRIIDPDFAGQDRVERHENVWKYLSILGDEAVADLSSLTPLTPEETSRSFANIEFEDPVPSIL